MSLGPLASFRVAGCGQRGQTSSQSRRPGARGGDMRPERPTLCPRWALGGVRTRWRVSEGGQACPSVGRLVGGHRGPWEVCRHVIRRHICSGHSHPGRRALVWKLRPGGI